MNKTRLEQEWCNGWNENELIEDLSPPWNQISPTVVLQSQPILGVHSGSIVIVNAVIIVMRKKKKGALKRDPTASQSCPSIILSFKSL